MKLVRPVAMTDAALVSSDVPEDDFTAWDIGTPYAVGAKVRRVATDVHKVFESAQSANEGNDPLEDAAGEWWIDLGPTNRWAMFDNVVQTQTTQAEQIEVVRTIEGRIDTLGLQNVSAGSVQVVMTDDDDGVVYDETFSLVSSNGIIDAYTYCFEPIVRLSDLTIEGLPPYGDPTLTVTLVEGDGVVACGLLLVGLARELGGTQWGASVGIRDYTVKQTDAFGGATVVRRAFSKRASFNLILQNQMVDAVQALLAEYRATPVLYVGDARYGSLTLFGFFREFAIDVAYPDRSYATLDIEGLI